MLQISLLLAACIDHLSIAIALMKMVRDTKKRGDIWILYVKTRVPGDCEEGYDLEADWEAMRPSKIYEEEGG